MVAVCEGAPSPRPFHSSRTPGTWSSSNSPEWSPFQSGELRACGHILITFYCTIPSDSRDFQRAPSFRLPPRPPPSPIYAPIQPAPAPLLQPAAAPIYAPLNPITPPSFSPLYSPGKSAHPSHLPVLQAAAPLARTPRSCPPSPCCHRQGPGAMREGCRKRSLRSHCSKTPFMKTLVSRCLMVSNKNVFKTRS